MLSDPHILLIANYRPDAQQSMLRFSELLSQELTARGVLVTVIQPMPVLARVATTTFQGAGKWLAYLDKFLIFPLQVRRAIQKVQAERESTKANRRDQRAPVVAHICDHSNAMYVRALSKVPHVITCHDLLAVRGALGDPEVFCPARRTGRVLQEWIRRSLMKAQAVACVSHATASDFRRLIKPDANTVRVIPMGLNAPFKRLPVEQIDRELLAAGIERNRPYLLHVGHSHPRKNRRAVVKTLQRLKDHWPGYVVFAGSALNTSVRELAAGEFAAGRVVEVVSPSHSLLNALYCGAHSLLFPSYAEGFGWPVLEALASGCPVICSNRTSLPEVGGPGAILVDPDDHHSMASAVLALGEPRRRESIIREGVAHAAKFETGNMIEQYLTLYRELAQRRCS